LNRTKKPFLARLEVFPGVPAKTAAYRRKRQHHRAEEFANLPPIALNFKIAVARVRARQAAAFRFDAAKVRPCPI
jgi:hypothetical protein